MAAWSREALVVTAVVGVATAAAAYALQRGDVAAQLRALMVKLVQLGRPSAPCVTLAALRRDPPVHAWVALCGTVFDVSDDPFFDAATGVYALWTGHDVTFLLVQMGVALDGADDAAMATYRDQQLPLELVASESESERTNTNLRGRRLALLKEWYVRFHTRYDVVAQIADLFPGAEWDAIREQLLPPAVRYAANGDRPRGKCPLGFGSRALDHVVSHADPNSTELRTVTFQGKRYDVTGSSLFQDKGEFAHFVGHDITFALATQSTQTEDLDVQPQREYTYAEQVLLERYRVAFARELALVATEGSSSSGASQEQVDMHALVDACEGPDGDRAFEALRAYLSTSTASVNQVCARSTMTPLHKAVEANRLDLVELLVCAGADMSAEAALYDYETPLQMAERFRYEDIAGFLSARKA